MAVLAASGREDGLPAGIAIDGKRLGGVGDGQVKLLAAMLHEDKVMIGLIRVPDETTEATQAKELLRDVDLENAVVTADAGASSSSTTRPARRSCRQR